MSRLKERIKDSLLKRLHAVPVQQFQLADAVACGVRGAQAYSFLEFRDEVLGYERTLSCGDFSYRYAASCGKPVLYASIYACMLEGLLGVLERRPEDERKAWGAFLCSHQREDGFFYDSGLAGEAFEGRSDWNEGWGKQHLLGHMIIALGRLGVVPGHPFRFLEPFYRDGALRDWLEALFRGKSMWTSSNYVMNLYTAMQYSRDWMNDAKAGHAVEVMADWLLKHQSQETGMWHKRPLESKAQALDVVRGAYHFYPLFEYDGIPIPCRERVIDTILPLQNRWGGFSPEQTSSGACEDIDALEPLIRFAAETGYRRPDVTQAVRQSFVWYFASRNSDGGFSFEPRSGQSYGGHPLTSSFPGESNLFATWFRTLALAYMCRYLGLAGDFDIEHFPGYEIR